MRQKSISLSFVVSSDTFFTFSAHFLGAPCQDRTWLFFRPFYCDLDAFLKKRMALPICGSRTWAAEGIAGTLVSRLMLLNCTWLKFGEKWSLTNWRSIISLFVFFLFLVFFSRLIKPALKNLDKFDYICCNGVAYEEKNKVWPTQYRFTIVFFL